MNTARKCKNLNAFTMTEMLITMGVLVILFAIIVSSFGGMRDSLAITDASNTFAQDIRFVQRSSLFLTRAPQERWIYGIGIDLGELGEDRRSNIKKYTLFKWCSPYNDYNANGDVKMRSELPAYDPSADLGILLNGKKNAYIVTNYISGQDYCPKCTGTNCTSAEALLPLSGYGLTDISQALDFEFVDVDGKPLTSDIPRFVLFESVTGRAFFYGNDGKLLNYFKDSNGLQLGVNSAIPANDIRLKISIGSDQDRIIEIKAVSGVVNIINKEDE